MNKPEGFRIRIKPIRPKAVKGKLPAPLPGGYPPRVPAVFVRKNCLDELRSYAASDTGYELGGVLVGKIGRASRRIFLTVEDFVPARKGISRRASFEFTNDTQQQMHEETQTRFPDLRIVGWFHTHPGYGVFLSSADQFIDRHYFREKFHIAVVLDPTRPGVEVGVFVWLKPGERVLVPVVATDENTDAHR